VAVVLANMMREKGGVARAVVTCGSAPAWYLQPGDVCGTLEVGAAEVTFTR
jgi:hypothetical protein